MAANPQPAPEAKRLSDEELAEYRTDPHREQTLGTTDHVICRECARTCRMINARHLGMPGHSNVSSLDLYKKVWLDAPTVCAEVHGNLSDQATGQWQDPDARQLKMNGLNKAARKPAVKKRRSTALRQAFKSDRIRKGRRERLNNAWRIAKWLDKQTSKSLQRLWWLVGGIYLLTHPTAANDDLLRYLDRLRVPRSDGKLWLSVAAKPSVKNDIWELRTSVGIRGVTFHRKKAGSSL